MPAEHQETDFTMRKDCDLRVQGRIQVSQRVRQNERVPVIDLHQKLKIILDFTTVSQLTSDVELQIGSK